MTLENLLPGQEKDFANWYTDELFIQEGDLLNYVHMRYASTFVKHIHMKIENRVVVDTRVEVNRGKKFPEKGKGDMLNLFV